MDRRLGWRLVTRVRCRPRLCARIGKQSGNQRHRQDGLLVAKVAADSDPRHFGRLSVHRLHPDHDGRSAHCCRKHHKRRPAQTPRRRSGPNNPRLRIEQLLGARGRMRSSFTNVASIETPRWPRQHGSGASKTLVEPIPQHKVESPQARQPCAERSARGWRLDAL